MDYEGLLRVCQPLSPGAAVAALQGLYAFLAACPDNVDDEWLCALNAAIEVMKAIPDGR